MMNRVERVLERTYNRMYPSLRDAVSSCQGEERIAILRTGMRAYLPLTSRNLNICDVQIDTYVREHM
ncbi:MAG: hypothetical protein IKU09_03485 [Firmicutes bacterium]|nr:hypothetical protein [Bacillota bacterium]